MYAPLDLPLPLQCGRHLWMVPFAVAEIEGGSDALRENVCRGRVVRRAGSGGGGGGDVERLIRIGHVHARLARLFEIPSLLLHFPVLPLDRHRNQMPCMILARDRGTTDLGNRIGVHLGGWKKARETAQECSSIARPPFRSHRALFPGNRFV